MISFQRSSFDVSLAMPEPEIKMFYEKVEDKLEIVAINENKLPEWQKHEFSKRIVGKNWNNAAKDISSQYCDIGAIPYYVLISPDKRIVWKTMGYQPGYFLGLAEVLGGGLSVKQDNSANLNLSIRNVSISASGTAISFRYYAHKSSGFSIANGSYLTANGKKYKLIAADGITLDKNNQS